MESAYKKTKRKRSVYKKRKADALTMSGTSSRSGWKAARTAAVNKTMKSFEKKNIDVTWPAATLNSAPSLTLLNPLVTGATAADRIGRRVDIRSIFLTCAIAYGTRTAVPAGSGFCRFVVVQDKQPNGVAPAITEIFANADCSAPMNLGNSRRFKVLADIVVDRAISNNYEGTFVKRYIKCNIRTEYKDGAGNGDITDITTNALFLVAWSADISAASNTIDTNPLIFSGKIRTRFVDP